MAFLTEIGKEVQRLQLNTAILRKKTEARVVAFPGFKLYYKAVGIKTIWYCHKNRRVSQRNRTESPEVTPCICDQLIFNKEAKNRQCGEEKVFEMVLGKPGCCTPKSEQDHCLTTHTKIDSKWIRDLIIKSKTKKFLEANTENKPLN